MSNEELADKMQRWVDDFWERFVAMRKGLGLGAAMTVLVDVFSLVMLSGGDRVIVDGKEAEGTLGDQWAAAAKAVADMLEAWSKGRLEEVKADPKYAAAVEAVERKRRDRVRESN